MGFLFKDKLKTPVAEKISNKIQATAPTSAVVPIVDGTDYIKHFEDVIKGFNRDGLDYYEFREGLKTPLPLTEQQKYENAYQMFKIGGISPGNIIDSADNYLVGIEKEKERFDTSWNDANRRKVLDVENVVVEKQKLIQQLNEQIQRESTNIINLQNTATQAKAELAGKKVNFEAAYANTRVSITEHINKIKTYLTNVKHS